VKPFRERNPVPIAAVGLVLLAAGVFAAFEAKHLPFIGGGPTLVADFSDAAGVQPNERVDIAGVQVGTVQSVKLAGNVVRVTMQLNNGTQLGRDTGADIKIETLLGQKYVQLDPAGPGQMPSGAVIPVSRTTTPLDVTTAFIGLARHIEAINTHELAKAFDTIAATFAPGARQVHGALVGLSRLSVTIASRDNALTSLLYHAKNVTGVLASRDAVLTRLINDGGLVLQMVEQQRSVIHDLLVNSTRLAIQLEGLVRDNARVIGPALTNLHSVIGILSANQNNLDRMVHLLAPFVRDFNNTLGNGQWFDTVVQNLGPPARYNRTSCLQGPDGSKPCPSG
jgi:phospholipid/cholesterol/gamma-HCH transport system substrate-binding protein